MAQEAPIKVFSTSPPSRDAAPGDYLERVRQVSRWSEQAGCHGILVYADNGLVDPWLVSQAIVAATERLSPLVAVQPVYMHPYSAAKMVATLAFLHGRAVDLNLLAGGFRNDLLALGDPTPHDERYARTTEYGRIVSALLAGEQVDLDGSYYRVEKLKLQPALAPELAPEILISGSSPAGLAAALALGAVPVTYPGPPGEEQAPAGADRFGVRVGLFARGDADDGWRIGHERFPADRAGQIAHRAAMSVSDSHWHRQLSGRVEQQSSEQAEDPDPYWLFPFRNYQTFCPYLVGTYERLALELRGYLALGCTHLILDVPASEDELGHVGQVLERALSGMSA